jgi:hypothetical protein
MASADDLNKYAQANSSYVTPDWAPITPAAEPFTRPCRAIRANTEGTVTVNMPGGNDRVLNFKAGETRYGIFLAVTAATAGDLEGAV